MINQLLNNLGVAALLQQQQKRVAETRDPLTWYKVIVAERLLYVPPVTLLHNNIAELDNFIEAVQSFSKVDLDLGSRDSKLFNWNLEDLKITHFEGVADCIKGLEQVRASCGNYVSVDIETRRVEWEDNRVLAIGFATGINTAYTFHGIDVFSNSYSEFIPELYKFLGSSNVKFIWHNGKFDITRLWYLLGIKGRIDEDTMLQHYISVNERRGTHSLKDLGALYLQAPKWDDDLQNLKKEYARKYKCTLSDFMYDMLPPEILMPYLGMDTLATLRLFILWSNTVEENPMYRSLIRAANCLAEVEKNGVQVDLEYLEDLEYDLESKLQGAEKDLQKVSAEIWNPVLYMRMTGAKGFPGETFNVKSPKQLKWMLEEVTGKKLENTNAATIEKLSEIQWPEGSEAEVFIKALSVVRKYSKYMDTYVQGFRECVCADSRIRGSFNLHGTETGRLSSSDPNMQNIPRDKMIKNMIVAKPGMCLLQLDYSQAELRVLAYLSRDKELIRVYTEGRDLHDATAENMFGPDFDKEQRVMAKTVNFGIVYGRGPGSIAEKFGKSMLEAKGIIDRWFRAYPGVKKYIDDRRRMAVKGEECTTPLGRVRHFAITNPAEINHIQNEYINTPIQSLASDFTLNALCQMIEKGYRVVSTVHDSIILEVEDNPEVVATTAKECVAIMEGVPSKLLSDWDLPFKADVAIGYKWGDLE